MSLKAPVAALLAVSLLPKLELPQRLERWLRSPRAQVAQGVAAYEKGDAKDASGHFETALRLRPEDPRVLLDAGIGRIATKRRDGAEVLERAAAAAGGDRSLRTAALYDLGNARFAAGDAAGAVRAYEDCLRIDPAHHDAKYNLELALRELDKPKPQTKQEQESPNGKREGEQQPGQGQGQGQPSQDRPQDQKPQDPGQGEPQRSQPQPQPGATPQAGANPLPNFQPQPDMSEAQAAAILEAVENREREARRAEAAKQAARRAAVEKDW